MAGSIATYPPIKRGSTSQIVRVKIYDSASTVGHAGKTTLSSTTAGLVIAVMTGNGSTGSALTYAAGSSTIESITTIGTYATPTATKCRFKEIDATNFPGWYEIQFADSVFATGRHIHICIKATAAGVAQCDVIIPLTDFDPYDVVRGGLTALPNAAAGDNNGLPITASLPSTFWQALLTDGAFSVTGSVGKRFKDAIPNAVAGQSGGLFVCGTNTGTVTITDGWIVNRSTADSPAVLFTGSGTGAGFHVRSGSGANANAIYAEVLATNGSGFVTYAAGNGSGWYTIGGANDGNGMLSIGQGAGAGQRMVGGANDGHGVYSTGGGGYGHGYLSAGGSIQGYGFYGAGGGSGSGFLGYGGTNGGHGIIGAGGAGSTGDGARFFTFATNGNGMSLAKTGTGKALDATVSADLVSILGSATPATALKAIYDSVEVGTCQSGSTSTTIKLATTAVASDDFYRDAAVVVTSATGAKQVRKITAYAGSTRVATVDAAWVSTPDATSTYAILGRLV